MNGKDMNMKGMNGRGMNGKDMNMRGKYGRGMNGRGKYGRGLEIALKGWKVCFEYFEKLNILEKKLYVHCS